MAPRRTRRVVGIDIGEVEVLTEGVCHVSRGLVVRPTPHDSALTEVDARQVPILDGNREPVTGGLGRTVELVGDQWGRDERQVERAESLSTELQRCICLVIISQCDPVVAVVFS